MDERGSAHWNRPWTADPSALAASGLSQDLHRDPGIQPVESIVPTLRMGQRDHILSHSAKVPRL